VKNAGFEGRSITFERSGYLIREQEYRLPPQIESLIWAWHQDCYSGAKQPQVRWGYLTSFAKPKQATIIVFVPITACMGLTWPIPHNLSGPQIYDPSAIGITIWVGPLPALAPTNTTTARHWILPFSVIAHFCTHLGPYRILSDLKNATKILSCMGYATHICSFLPVRLLQKAWLLRVDIGSQETSQKSLLEKGNACRTVLLPVPPSSSTRKSPRRQDHEETMLTELRKATNGYFYLYI